MTVRDIRGEMTLEAALRDLEHRDPKVRARAAEALGRTDLGDPALTALLGATNDGHSQVRYAALLSLGELGRAPGVAAALTRLEDGDSLVREAAVIALGQIGARVAEKAPAERSELAALDQAFAALSSALGSERPEVRFQAIASLAEISPERAAPLLAPLLSDRDPKVRAQAAAALGDARFMEAREPLATLLGDVDEVRHEAALALARLGDARAVPVLLTSLPAGDRAFDAASALAELDAARAPEVRDFLARLLLRFLGDPMVKVRAAQALARAGDPRGRAHLEKALRSRRDEVRGLASAVLSDLDGQRDHSRPPD